MVGDLFVHLAFEDFRKGGQDGYRYVTVWVWSVFPFEEGMTAAAFQSLGISDDTKELLNRLVVADNFRKRGSTLSSPADL